MTTVHEHYGVTCPKCGLDTAIEAPVILVSTAILHGLGAPDTRCQPNNVKIDVEGIGRCHECDHQGPWQEFIDAGTAKTNEPAEPTLDAYAVVIERPVMLQAVIKVEAKSAEDARSTWIGWIDTDEIIAASQVLMNPKSETLDAYGANRRAAANIIELRIDSDYDGEDFVWADSDVFKIIETEALRNAKEETADDRDSVQGSTSVPGTDTD